MRANTFRQLIAIEVKAGSDFSNIHNRIGEAEKAIRKLRQMGLSSAGPWSMLTISI